MYILGDSIEGASFHTTATIDAAKGIIIYRFSISVHHYCIRWAYSGTGATEGAFLPVEMNLPTVSRSRFPYVLKRITPGSGFRE
jgi:hypothetical protein